MVDPAVAKEIADAVARQRALEAERAVFDENWRRIAEYVLPRRDFEFHHNKWPNPRPRRLVDSTAMVANERLAALLFGNMLPPQRQWFRPSVPARAEELGYVETRWLQETGEAMFKSLVRPSTRFIAAAYEALQDACAFGNAVMWGGRTADGQIVFTAQPLTEHFWEENADGVIDRDHRRFHWRLRDVLRRFPDAPGLAKKLEADPKGTEWIELLQVTEPNPGGRIGGIATNKPFLSTVYAVPTQEVLTRQGFDSFPWIIFRFSKRAGQAYGEGPGTNVLPLARLLNEMEEAVIRAAELRIDPPLYSFAEGLKKFTRQPGAVQQLSAAQLRRLGMTDPSKIVGPMWQGGDAGIAVETIRDIRQKIEDSYFIDWMSLGVNGSMTATEVLERRDIRLASMSPIVARLESEFLSPVADRLYTLMQDALPRPPETLGGMAIDWEFFSPLADAQQRNAVEAHGRIIAMLEAGAALKPDVTDNVDLDEAYRDAMQAAGLPARHLMPPAGVAELRRRRSEAAAQETAIDQAAGIAGAARDAGQAAASMQPEGQV